MGKEARPTLGTGNKGFTLVEVLVVVAIAGIIVALASVNLFPGSAERARREVNAMALAIEHARDNAWFGGRPAAITFSEGRLREWRYAARSWEPDASRDTPLEARVTGLFVDGTQLPATDRLVFMPDGLGVPFTVALDFEGLAFAVEGDAAGAITMVQR